jgi:hypothetical protein
MTFQVITYGLVGILIMLLVETFASRRQHRRAEIGTALVAGLLGIGYCLGMLYAIGALA